MSGQNNGKLKKTILAIVFILLLGALGYLLNEEFDFFASQEVIPEAETSLVLPPAESEPVEMLPVNNTIKASTLTPISEETPDMATAEQDSTPILSTSTAQAPVSLKETFAHLPIDNNKNSILEPQPAPPVEKKVSSESYRQPDPHSVEALSQALADLEFKRVELERLQVEQKIVEIQQIQSPPTIPIVTSNTQISIPEEQPKIIAIEGMGSKLVAIIRINGGVKTVKIGENISNGHIASITMNSVSVKDLDGKTYNLPFEE